MLLDTGIVHRRPCLLLLFLPCSALHNTHCTLDVENPPFLPFPRPRNLETGPLSSLPRKYRDAVTKWTESAWKMVIYAFFVAIAVISVYDQDFLHRSAALWEGCFDLPCEFRHAPRLRSIYLMEMSYYTYGIFALFFWEARRKDHLVMLAHHVVTLGLIAFSFWYNFLRVGVLIMLLHDVCDVPMEFAKVIR